ncbi:MAG: DUF6903 family protein [Faecousia sp.]
MDWKKQEKLRVILMALFFIAGLVLTFLGWKMTGKLEGLCLMILGMIFLLATLFIYNAPYNSKR